MRSPTVHINGASGGALMDQILKAKAALDAALDAMREACPNGRDYYLQGSDAIGDALAEHRARILAVENVLRQYDDIYEAIANQLEAAT